MKANVFTTLVLAAAILAGNAAAGARDEATVVMSDKPAMAAIENEWGFSDAIVAGDTVYLSGVVAGLKNGDGDLQAAYARAFDKLGAILAKAGASWDDVVEITSYHTDVKAQMPAMVAAKKKYVRAPYPAWTAVQVVRLIPDNGITEIKLIARLPSRLQPVR